MKTAICLALLTATLISCNDKKDLTIFPAGCELKTGDIVFRRGGGISSHAVMMADRNGRYSHVGIVVDSAGKKMIVHAVPDEPDFEGDPDRVKMETPEKFFSPINANAGEVKRLKGDTIIPLKAAEYAMQTYRRNTLFDHDYDEDVLLRTRGVCLRQGRADAGRNGAPRHKSAGHEKNKVHAAV